MGKLEIRAVGARHFVNTTVGPPGNFVPLLHGFPGLFVSPRIRPTTEGGEHQYTWGVGPDIDFGTGVWGVGGDFTHKGGGGKSFFPTILGGGVQYCQTGGGDGGLGHRVGVVLWGI